MGLQEKMKSLFDEVLTRSAGHEAASLGSGWQPPLDLFEELVAAMRQHGHEPQTGRFGADMQVKLCNDGPVTFWLEVRQAD